MGVSCILESCCCSYSSLYFFIFLSLQFSHITIFCHTFLRNCEALKVETWYTCGQWEVLSCIVHTGIRLLLIFIPLFLHFLSLQLSNIKIFHHTFLRNCEALKVETWYTRGQWEDVSCIPESGFCSYLSLYFFIFFLSSCQTLKFFVTLFSG